MLHRLLRLLAYFWASPWTVLALVIGGIAKLFGDKAQFYFSVIVFYGPVLDRILKLAPIPGGAAAITLGHVVLARNFVEVERTYRHEMVHVRQYERWGIFFVPAYLLSSLWLLLRRRDPYRENPFERPAFAVDQTSASSPASE